MRSLVAAVALVSACSSLARSDVTRDQAARLGVDVVLLKGGRQARGSIIERHEDGGLSIAIRRQWLEDRQPQWAEELNAVADAERRAALETLLERTRNWLRERADDQRLCAVLRIELERLERAPAADQAGRAEQSQSEFMMVRVAGAEIRRVYSQPAERRRLAQVAWQAGIDRVESTPVNRLRDALERRQVDWRGTVVNLSDRLSSPSADSEREWAARKAIYEYSLREPVEFQGTGDFVVRTGDDVAAPAGLELAGGLLQGGLPADLSALVQEALGEGAKPKVRRNWLETATKAAEKAGANGFRVTRTDQDIQRRSVSVEDRFVARMPDGTWETVWQATVPADASLPRKDLEARIRQDDQVAEALKLAEGLGLGGGIDTAVRFGAATMEAQQTASGRYFEFIDRYTQRLEGPVLKWAGDQK